MISTEIIVSIVGVAGSSVIAYFGYKRGSKSDATAADNAVDALLIGGYGSLLKSVQEDNTSLRARFIDSSERFDSRLAKTEKDLEDCRKQMDDRVRALEERLRRLI